MSQAGAVSASSSTTTVISGSHLFNISGHSITKELPSGKYITSSSFIAGGYSWAIRYYPNGLNSYNDDGIAFNLELLSEEGRDVQVMSQFSLMGPDGTLSQTHTKRLFCEFRYGSCYEGISGFITHEELEESGYLRDDSFVMKCTVGVIESGVVEASASPTSHPGQVDQLPPSDLHEHLGKLLESGEGADVTFNVSGQIFSAHRCILAARSPVFHAQFFGPMRENSFDKIEVEDMEAMIFEILLQYLYTDSLPELKEFGYNKRDTSASAMVTQHLLAAADRYSIERLKIVCEQKLFKNLSIDTVTTTLALAEQHDCAQLKESCIRFLTKGGNLKEVIATDGFRHLTLSCPSIFDEILVNVTDPVVLRDLVMKFSRASITS